MRGGRPRCRRGGGAARQRRRLTEWLRGAGVRRAADGSDASAGFDVLPGGVGRFEQRFEAFSRSWWDPKVRSKRTEQFYDSYRKPLSAEWRGRSAGGGFGQRDFALRNAAWGVADIFAERRAADDRREGFLDELTALRDGPEEKLDLGSPEEAARHVKHVALLFGASKVGICATDDRWHYETRFGMKSRQKPNALHSEPPPGCGEGPPADSEVLPHCVVVATAMDEQLTRTVPSALAGAATGLGYGHDALVLLSVSQYLKNAGYRAVPSMNDSALAIPYAVKAGLGEYGLNGLLITPEFGPRVRLGKIFTDLPLAHDAPVRFGVREFCQQCERCSKGCPAKAIPSGPPRAEPHNESNIRGVRKWTVDGEKCFKYWASLNTDCSVCIRVCPFNRGSAWYHQLWRWLAGTRLRGIMLRIDDWTERAKKLRPDDYWKGALGR